MLDVEIKRLKAKGEYLCKSHLILFSAFLDDVSNHKKIQEFELHL